MSDPTISTVNMHVGDDAKPRIELLVVEGRKPDDNPTVVQYGALCMFMSKASLQAFVDTANTYLAGE